MFPDVVDGVSGGTSEMERAHKAEAIVRTLFLEGVKYYLRRMPSVPIAANISLLYHAHRLCNVLRQLRHVCFSFLVRTGPIEPPLFSIRVTSSCLSLYLHVTKRCVINVVPLLPRVFRRMSSR
ncbi:hypothetical protein, unlikely [Trypanosoma brucei gambiense DAL972]|uniref:Uncharacterized protein n=1 Tax=Trypanosoma brucei gambiense (strain MHOM/CI/86/DAL972) TaxID=679716 RepID=C9ZL91_TRYB9|nr:hypothetical protein, unlikely [Trypanosoma brucei gambiense DAL972]CBH10100.1 hypothetical protein, unlikely [Trypanosoma brucei gambiense DAL972]|eukprot:XP_011772390.1 hypothetical protein, unlikely [Trypanosoma brucei gambiense DAL972]